MRRAFFLFRCRIGFRRIRTKRNRLRLSVPRKFTDKTVAPSGCEIRSFFNGRNLLIGCPFCGGYAYELLKRFFESVTGGTVPYDVMNEWAESAVGKKCYEKIKQFDGRRKNLIGTGNAVRKNRALRKIICEDFGMKLLIPQQTEEAAYGAAILAAESCCGQSLKRFIKYSDGC